jgi:predicted transcriptional regulator
VKLDLELGHDAMADRDENNLSRRERQIMDIVYARGEVAASEVLDTIPDPPTYTTVRTLLRILEDKGHLKHRQEGTKFIYFPSRSRQRVGGFAFRRLLETFYDGSLEKAVAAYLSESPVDLPPEELRRLVDLIDKARKKGQ